jgi:hypothetical protein
MDCRQSSIRRAQMALGLVARVDVARATLDELASNARQGTLHMQALRARQLAEDVQEHGEAVDGLTSVLQANLRSQLDTYAADLAGSLRIHEHFSCALQRIKAQAERLAESADLYLRVLESPDVASLADLTHSTPGDDGKAVSNKDLTWNLFQLEVEFDEWTAAIERVVPMQSTAARASFLRTCLRMLRQRRGPRLTFERERDMEALRLDDACEHYALRCDACRHELLDLALIPCSVCFESRCTTCKDACSRCSRLCCGNPTCAQLLIGWCDACHERTSRARKSPQAFHRDWVQ